MTAWNIWFDDPPGREVWIRGMWSWGDAHTLIVKTCRRGCCVQEPHMGSMTLPKFWLPATADEIASVENRPRKSPDARADSPQIAAKSRNLLDNAS